MREDLHPERLHALYTELADKKEGEEEQAQSCFQAKYINRDQGKKLYPQCR